MINIQRLKNNVQMIIYTNKNIRGMPLNSKTLVSLFDRFVRGVVNYDTEIWRTHEDSNVEKLHADFYTTAWCKT